MSAIRDEWTTQDGSVRLLLGDCLEILPQIGMVDACVTDPPYGLGMRTVSGGTAKNTQTRFIDDLKEKRWDISPPSKDTFSSLMHISGNQVFWGGNYFELPPTRCVLVWDKMTYVPTMSRVEIAWTSLDGPARYVQINSNNPDRVHATQKPVALMEWCLGFLPDAETILDPFMGSGTTGLACIRLGRKFIGIEREPKYFEIAKKRIQNELAKTALIETPKRLVQTSFMEAVG